MSYQPGKMKTYVPKLKQWNEVSGPYDLSSPSSERLEEMMNEQKIAKLKQEELAKQKRMESL